MTVHRLSLTFHRLSLTIHCPFHDRRPPAPLFELAVDRDGAVSAVPALNAVHPSCAQAPNVQRWPDPTSPPPQSSPQHRSSHAASAAARPSEPMSPEPAALATAPHPRTRSPSPVLQPPPAAAGSWSGRAEDWPVAAAALSYPPSSPPVQALMPSPCCRLKGLATYQPGWFARAGVLVWSSGGQRILTVGHCAGGPRLPTAAERLGQTGDGRGLAELERRRRRRRRRPGVPTRRDRLSLGRRCRCRCRAALDYSAAEYGTTPLCGTCMPERALSLQPAQLSLSHQVGSPGHPGLHLLRPRTASLASATSGRTRSGGGDGGVAAAAIDGLIERLKHRPAQTPTVRHPELQINRPAWVSCMSLVS